MCLLAFLNLFFFSRSLFTSLVSSNVSYTVSLLWTRTNCYRYLSSCMCKRCWCNHKLNKMSEGNLCKVCECIDIVYTCMNSWKELFDIYIFSMWIFSLFWSLNWYQACFKSDTIVASRRWTPYCLCWLYKKKDHHERIKTQTGDSALVESRDTKTIYINYILTIYI
jgi:hypothetical protein